MIRVFIHPRGQGIEASYTADGHIGLDFDNEATVFLTREEARQVRAVLRAVLEEEEIDFFGSEASSEAREAVA